MRAHIIVLSSYDNYMAIDLDFIHITNLYGEGEGEGA
jgi:hypothetical protein